MTRVIPVEIDASMHEGQPEDAQAAVVWAALDTAYNLLRDTAVEVVLMDIRKQAAEQGHNVPEDVLLFMNSGLGESGIKGYRDLAPDHPLAAEGIMRVFEVLHKVCSQEAQAGINQAKEEGSE